jgi:hypothetical protein
LPSNAPNQAVCSFFCRSTPPDNALLSENVSNTGGVVAGVEFATSYVALEEFAGELGVVGVLTKRQAEASAISDFFDSNLGADKVLANLRRIAFYSTAYSVAETLTDQTTSKLFQTRDCHLCSFE